MKPCFAIFAISVGAACLSSAATFNVTWNSSGLQGVVGRGPFQLDFGLNEGGVFGNNSISLTNFNLGGGSVGAVSFLGGATAVESGNQISSVSLSDTSSLNYATFDWTPGTNVNFTLRTVNDILDKFPDTFQWGVIDECCGNPPGTYIGTTGPVSELLSFDIGGSKPVIGTFGPSARETLRFSAPVVTAVVPEPATWILMGLGGLLLGFRRWPTPPRLGL